MSTPKARGARRLGRDLPQEEAHVRSYCDRIMMDDVDRQ